MVMVILLLQKPVSSMMLLWFMLSVTANVIAQSSEIMQLAYKVRTKSPWINGMPSEKKEDNIYIYIYVIYITKWDLSLGNRPAYTSQSLSRSDYCQKTSQFPVSLKDINSVLIWPGMLKLSDVSLLRYKMTSICIKLSTW